jgi:hypothetical protein
VLGSSANYIIDSGSVNGRIFTVEFQTPAAAASTDSVKVRYTSNCGPGAWKVLKMANAAVSTNPPAAPASITIALVSDSCGARRYRYTAPALTAASATASAATGWDWTFVGGLYAAGATIDSGTTSSRVITVTYASNAAALTGDSAKVRFTSLCGNGPWKAQKLSNLVKTGCPPPSSSNPPISRVDPAQANQKDMLVASAFPNPTTTSFNLKVQSSDMNRQVEVRIVDVQGRHLSKTMVMPGETIQMGSDLTPGTYMVHVVQGKQSRVVRVIKL